MSAVTQSTEDLTGKLLIAMPSMGDPRFATTVILLCAHSDEAAMGLVLNKPSRSIEVADVLGQLGITAGPDTSDLIVYRGGPVEKGRGFVLHEAAYDGGSSSLSVPGGFALTATRDILVDIAGGSGPDQRRLMLGYAGWGDGQLEDELAENAWLTCDATPDLVFNTPPAKLWEAALQSLGIEPIMLSGEAGHA